MRGVSTVLCLIGLLLALIGCLEVRTKTVRYIKVALPDGTVLNAEMAENPDQRARGLMGRDSLPIGSAMLFRYEEPGRHSFWMEKCLIPLDIIWMDTGHRVVDATENAPPCKGGGQNCPTYGGILKAQYVLELPGGQAAVHHVQTGSVLRW